MLLKFYYICFELLKIIFEKVDFMEKNSDKYSEMSKEELIDKVHQLEKDADVLEVTLHSIDEGVIKTDSNGIITNMNSIAENLTGWHSSLAVGKDISIVLNLYGVDKKVKLKSPVEKVLKTGTKKTLESYCSLFSKNGKSYNISLSAAPIKNIYDEIYGVIIVFKDDTEKFEIEQKIRESEKRYKSLIDEMHYGLALHEIVLDDKGAVVDYVFLEINRAFEKQTGLKRQDIIGKRVLEVLPDLESYWIEKFGYVALSGESIHFENYVRELDKYFEVIAYRPQKNQFAVMANDITNRKISDDLLIESERKIKSILNTVPVGIGLLKENKVVEANKYLCDILKYNFHEIIGLEFEDFFVSKEFFYQVWPGKLNQLDENDISSLETQWIRKDGKNITVLLSSSPIIYDEIYYGTTFSVLDISERKEQEMNLRKSEHKYREVIDFAVGGILIGSSEGLILDANNLACKLLGKSYGQIVGKHVIDKIFVQENLKDSSFRFDLVDQGETVVNNRDIKLSDDKTITVETHTKQMPDKTYQMILHDVTERKKTENIIAKSEEKFLTAFKHNPIPTILSALYTGVIIDINDACEEITGWTRSEVVGQTTIEINMWINDNDRNDIFEEIELLGGIKNKRIDIYTKHLQKITVLFSATPILIDDQNCILASAVNITSISKIQKKLDISEKRYGFLVENINDLVISTDVHGNFLFVSDSFCKIFGKKQSEVIHKSFLHFVQNEDINTVSLAFEELKEEPHKCYFEIHALTKRGIRYFAWSDKAILNENGEVETIIGIGRDITERKEVEEKLLKAKEEAEESSRLKTSFLSNMSHEIRTPMNAIMGFAELLKKPSLDLAKQEEFADIIMSSSKQLLSIIDDIIEISRIDSGLIKINKSPFYLSSFFSNIHATLDLFIPKNKDLKINAHDYVINNNLLFFTDEVKLKQIFTNLLTNAIKYTPNGFVEYGYSLKTKNEITFYVKDTGIGIDPKYHISIFERFKQISNEFSWNQSGSGLGLSISKAFVEILGGKIWIESEVGSGSVFYFTIPIENVKNHQFAEILESNNELIDFNGSSLLIVEDNEMNFKYLSNLFTEHNVNVIHAKNGLEAVEICKHEKNIKIVLMDLKMPVMNGIDACTEILKHVPDLLIIAQTAYTSPDDKERAIAIGCKAFISKPIREKELFQIISKVLKQ